MTDRKGISELLDRFREAIFPQEVTSGREVLLSSFSPLSAIEVVEQPSNDQDGDHYRRQACKQPRGESWRALCCDRQPGARSNVVSSQHVSKRNHPFELTG